MLDIADLAQRREAAEAAAEGAVLFHAFGNVHAPAARLDCALDRMNGVTTTPERGKHVFDWDAVRLPWGALVAVMSDLQTLGPIGFRGPAAASIPAHLTRSGTVQLLSPGDACPSNALVADVLDLCGEELLATDVELRRPDRDDVVLIGHRNERAVRRRYPHHLPCAPSIVAFDGGELVLERHGSLDSATIERIADRHGLVLRIAPTGCVPVRRRRRFSSAGSAPRRLARAAVSP